MTLTYKAEPASSFETVEELAGYLLNELINLELAIEGLQPEIMEELNAEPSRPRTGLTVLADGTNWNPGSGQGVYTYYGAAWHKLG